MLHGLRAVALLTIGAAVLCGAPTDLGRPGDSALLPRTPRSDEPALALRLNVPAFRLELLDGERVVRTIQVAVGARDYRTPIGRFRVSSIEWNPWWFPPRSPWAANDTVTPPCPQNPVGRVKLNFAPSYFIHGTTRLLSLGHAASHGCVRASNDDALALAADIVGAVLPDTAPLVNGWLAGGRTHRVALTPSVPLEIRYALAERDGDTLRLYPDVYRRVPATARRVALALSALAQSGADTARVDRGQLRALIIASRRGPVAVPLSSLLSR